MKSLESKLLTNPLTPEHWIQVEGIYNSIRRERGILFWDWPPNITWLRVRYLKRLRVGQTRRTLGSLSWKLGLENQVNATLSLHRELFEFPDPMLLRGVIHHEMIHLLLGPEAQHDSEFKKMEQEWDDYEIYDILKSTFFASLRMLRDQDSQIRLVE